MAAKRKKATRKKPAAKPAAAPSAAAPAETTSKVKVTPHPTSTRVVDFEQKLEQQIQTGPPESDKRPRGRPLGSTKEPEGETTAMIAVDRKVIEDFIRIPFDMWATSQRIKGLRLTDKEVESLANPAITLLNYYVPEVPAIAFAWASLAITAYSVTSPRLVFIEQAREELKIKNEALRNANQNRPVQPRGPAPTPLSSESGKFPRPDEVTPLEIKH